MSLKNNVLSDRLDKFKNDPKSQKEKIQYPQNSIFINFFNTIILFATFFIKSVAFGYAMKVIFSSDWNFWEVICIGLSINFIFSFIYELIYKRR